MVAVKKRIFIVIFLVLLGSAGFFGHRWMTRQSAPSDTITLYGNVDIRQVQLAFNDSERIERLLVDEGSAVHAGQLVAQLVQQHFQDAVAQSQSTVAAQQQVVARLLAGSRPEEIAQARANVAAAQADVEAAQANVTNAELFYSRQQTLAKQQYVSLQIRDDAERHLYRHRLVWLPSSRRWRPTTGVAACRHRAAQGRHCRGAGNREGGCIRAGAGAEAVGRYATVRSRGRSHSDRILETGDMATAQTPVFTLALDNPLWVRAYLPEPEMGKVALGMRAWIESDSFPGQRFPGWIGYISPVSEFTPKNVETTQLRSQLVYRVRVYACNPGDRLRLGMPATVSYSAEWQSSPCHRRASLRGKVIWAQSSNKELRKSFGKERAARARSGISRFEISLWGA